jgi:hypothetical protein
MPTSPTPTLRGRSRSSCYRHGPHFARLEFDAEEDPARQGVPGACGTIIVYDAIIDDERRENAFGLLMSLNMLIETPGGFDYTGADCRERMREAGFSETRVEPLVGPDSMVIGLK